MHRLLRWGARSVIGRVGRDGEEGIPGRGVTTGTSDLLFGGLRVKEVLRMAEKVFI